MTKFYEVHELARQNATEVEGILNQEEGLSNFEDYGDFQLFILRRMELSKRELSFQSTAFVIKGTNVYLYLKGTKHFEKLKKNIAEMLILIEGYYAGNQRVLTCYSNEIEILENFLFDRNIPGYFMDMWFDLKKDLSRIENFYFRNAIVYREFLKRMGPLYKEFADEFKDVEDNIQFQSSNLQTLKGRLDGLRNYYDSIKDDRLNKTLLMLTVISGIFLPLNLIVGFFGMNTPGLFFQNEADGTKNVLVLLGVVLVVSLLGIKIIRLIDYYILRFLLDRYDFYKSILKRSAADVPAKKEDAIRLP